MSMVKIKDRLIGDGQPAYIIAEMSANHAGSIERAKEIIRTAKECGADCVKIQTYTSDTLTIDCDNEYFQIGAGTWNGENLYQLYGKAYTPWEWQKELKEEADKVGIDFFSTPFDESATDFLEEIGCEFYKIASFELVDIPLIEYVASKGKPMIMSTGMASVEEIEEAVQAVRKQGNDQLVLLKCSSAYPAVSEDMHLKTIADMKERFQIPIGLSDHSMGSMGAVVAVSLGANVIEKHFCISREIENPDASFSMTPEEFKQMVTDIRTAEKAMGIPTYGVSKQEENSVVFRRSIFAVKDIEKGEKLTTENIRIIRPGYGMKPKYFKEILGSVANEAMKRGTPLKETMLLKIQEAKETDAEILYQWKNDPVTRANSFCEKEVTWEKHKEWFSKKLKAEECRLYICRMGNIPVGQIRLDIEKEQKAAVISYSVDKEFRGKRIGTKMLELAEEKVREKKDLLFLTGEVKKENVASSKCFESRGFEKQQKDGEASVIIYKKQIGR